jgi:hypothetical protein
MSPRREASRLASGLVFTALALLAAAPAARADDTPSPKDPAPASSTAPAAPVKTDTKNEGESKPPILGYVLAGTGIAAMGVGGFFGIKQQLDYNHLQSTCAPRCSRSDADSIADQRLVAAITGGAGVVLVAVGAILIFSSRSASARTAPRVDVALGPGGGTFALTFTR